MSPPPIAGVGLPGLMLASVAFSAGGDAVRNRPELTRGRPDLENDGAYSRGRVEDFTVVGPIFTCMRYRIF
jgi:hypothetical protein